MRPSVFIALPYCVDVCRHFEIEGYGRGGGAEDDDRLLLRRSTRQRKFLYGTFDQSHMLDEDSVESLPQDKPTAGDDDDEDVETRQQQNELQHPSSDKQPPSDAEVTSNTS